MKTTYKLHLTLLLSFLLVTATLMSFNLVKERFSYTDSVELKTLKNLDAEIRFNAGTLNLSSHTESKMNFNSSFSKNSWKALIKLNQQSGKLSILQPEEENNSMKDEDKNDWQIKLPASLPTNLRLTIGAGEGVVDLKNSHLNTMELEAGAGNFDINLANTTLNNLKVNAGVGALSVDISGEKKNNLTAEINGGIGEVKLILPKQAGVKVKVSGLGDFKRDGFKKQEGYYVNNAYGKASKNVEVEVNGGLGSIELILK
jgi:hypothetical protein